MKTWVARLDCGHDTGDSTTAEPEVGWQVFCSPCGQGRKVEAVITDEPLKDEKGRAW